MSSTSNIYLDNFTENETVNANNEEPNHSKEIIMNYSTISENIVEVIVERNILHENIFQSTKIHKR